MRRFITRSITVFMMTGGIYSPAVADVKALEVDDPGNACYQNNATRPVKYAQAQNPVPRAAFAHRPPLDAVDPHQWDPKLEARSRQIFPFVSQEQRRLLWLQEQDNIQRDRQHGNSYSVDVH
jgi:hypothetical protein